MSTSELLEPRYKVIALWPGTLLAIGDIILPHPEYGLNTYPYPEKYPHLFKEMGWHEDREKADMPIFVKFIVDYDDYKKGCITAVLSWHKYPNCACLIHDEISPEYLTPATETEYLNFKNKGV